MDIKIYNTLSRQKEILEPIQAGKVSIYCCGPTVYDSFHIGHARPIIAFDILRRFLELAGFQVTFISNFTDIDDKIINRAISENRSWKEITLVYIQEYFDLINALGVKPATKYPRCSQYIDKMTQYIQELIDRDHAYESEGDVYFDVSSYPEYGALSGRKVGDQLDGASGRTGEEVSRKRHPADFALWKTAKKDEPSWDSPWGAGRPGWHIECSVMSSDTLGPQFDIHCGGHDLIFPHHENELAQSRAHGDKFAKYWMHNGFVGFDYKSLPEEIVEKIRAEQPEAVDEKGNIKLGKSLWKYLEPLGMAQWLKDLIKPAGKFDPMVVRMALISTHYRQHIHYSQKLLEEAAVRYERLLNTLDNATRYLENMGDTRVADDRIDALRAITEKAEIDFTAALADDINSALALASLFELCTAINTYCTGTDDPDSTSREVVAVAREMLVELMGVLGLRPSRLDTQAESGDSEALVQLLLEVRSQARNVKQFGIADLIRDRLANLGWQIEDLPGGKWTMKQGL